MSIDQDRLLERLNPPQREAVTHGEGPLLILAGAGSGKTRVITHRIAWLVGVAGADPRQVVAMTFTNKAAKEMRERAESLLRHDLAGAYVGTFHAFGLRLLRMHALDAGYPPTFVVYDSADQLAAVRASLKELSLDDKSMTPRQVLSWISRQKNALVDPDAAAARAMTPQDASMSRVYALYAERLKRAGAMDFDDLLVQLIRLFRTRPDVADRHAQRIRWLLVDEYQDTNPIQYALIRMLAGAPPQRLLRRRRGPVDLRLPRGRHPEHPGLRAGLQGRDDRQARAELPLDPEHPGGRDGGDPQQRQPPRQDALDRERGGREAPAPHRAGRPGRGRLRRRDDAEAGARARDPARPGRRAVPHERDLARCSKTG